MCYPKNHAHIVTHSHYTMAPSLRALQNVEVNRLCTWTTVGHTLGTCLPTNKRRICVGEKKMVPLYCKYKHEHTTDKGKRQTSGNNYNPQSKICSDLRKITKQQSRLGLKHSSTTVHNWFVHNAANLWGISSGRQNYTVRVASKRRIEYELWMHSILEGKDSTGKSGARSHLNK